MKLKSIRNFLDCRESIIQIEVSRCLLNQSSGEMSDDRFDRLWNETDVLLNKEIKRLGSMLSDDKGDWETLCQAGELVADKALIKSIIHSDDNISVDDIACYIKQDIDEKLAD